MLDEEPIEMEDTPNNFAFLGLRQVLYISGVGLCGAILVLNLCILLRIMCSKRLRTPTNILLVNLTLADFLLGLAFLVPSMINLIFASSISTNNIELFSWIYSIMSDKNSSVALAVYAPMATSMLVSILTLTAMAVNKYIKIFHPYRFMRMAANMKQSLSITVLLIWSVSIAVCTLPLLVMNTENKCHLSANTCKHIKLIVCMFHSIFKTDHVVVFTAICLTCSCVIFVLYVRIYFQANREFRFISQRSSLKSAAKMNSTTMDKCPVTPRKTSLRSLPDPHELCKVSICSNRSAPVDTILNHCNYTYLT
jgi:hypothetical protein